MKNKTLEVLRMKLMQVIEDSNNLTDMERFALGIAINKEINKITNSRKINEKAK